MKIYTVHEPNPRRDEIASDPDRFRFVRDGFHFWAFLLGPVWMLWHRLWLVLVIFLLGTAAIQWGLSVLGVSGEVRLAPPLWLAPPLHSGRRRSRARYRGRRASFLRDVGRQSPVASGSAPIRAACTVFASGAVLTRRA